MNKNIFQKNYSLNLIFGIIDFCLIVFVIVFPVKTIIEDTKTLSSLKENILLIEKQGENLRDFDRNRRIYLQEIEKIDSVFVDAKVPVDFLDLLDKVSQTAAFEIKISPTVSSTSKKDIFPSIVFQITGKGKPENFLKFLEKIENIPYLTEIPDFNLKSVKALGKNTGPSLEVEANFSIRAFSK